jgi:hypothetical protein
MRLIIFSSLLIIISCGKVELNVGDSIGEFKNVSPLVVGGQEFELLNSVCKGIAQKTIALPMLVNSTMTFSYAMRGCQDRGFNDPVDIITTIQNSFGGYRIVKSDGSVFFFSDPESTESGTMSLFCKQIAEAGNLQNPLQLGQEYFFITTSGISSENCSVSGNDVCIEVAKGSSDPSGMAKIHTKEWIRISLDPLNGRKGFFTSKKQISSLGCAEGKILGHKAILK